MGQKQDFLTRTIRKSFEIQRYEKLSSADILNSNYSNEIKDIYSVFKGQLHIPPTKFGSWDIATSKFIIELDEERHFNRYRSITLNSPFYLKHQNFSVADYQTYCSIYENACLKAASWGKNWKNDSTEKQFCKSNTYGLLTGNGSSRWKQRAYYDFLRDISGKIMELPIIRLSIYDTYKNISVEKILKTEQENVLLDLIETKIKQSATK